MKTGSQGPITLTPEREYLTRTVIWQRARRILLTCAAAVAAVVILATTFSPSVWPIAGALAPMVVGVGVGAGLNLWAGHRVKQPVLRRVGGTAVMVGGIIGLTASTTLPGAGWLVSQARDIATMIETRLGRLLHRPHEEGESPSAGRLARLAQARPAPACGASLH